MLFHQAEDPAFYTDLSHSVLQAAAPGELMKWVETPFLDELVCKDYRRLKRKIIKKKPHPPVYLLVLPERSSKNLLEILPSFMLLQKNYPEDGLLVIGMAHSREKAFEMIEELFAAVYEEGFGTDLRAYMDLS